jgi:hypothetical protein
MTTTPRTPQPLTADQLAEIQVDVAAYEQHPKIGFACCSAHRPADHVPAIRAEVDRLRAEITAAVDRLRDMQRLEPVHARAAALHGVEMQLRFAIGTEEEAAS